MKFKLLLLTISFLTFSIPLFAKSLPDSIGVENHNGKMVILHKIKAKDNYYAIGRRYHVSPKEIIKYNDNAKMTIGHTIKVPTDRPFSESKHEKTAAHKEHKKKDRGNEPAEKPQPENPVARQPVAAPPVQQPKPEPETDTDNTPPTQYKVSAHETLFSIAKRFNSTVDDIIKLNHLQSNNIQPGQLLIVKAGSASSPASTPPPVTHPSDSIVAKRDSTSMALSSDSSHHLNANKYGLFEKDEKGVATWIDDDGLDPNKMLVLHRTAPIGTVIKITNVMTNRTTFAKVVGRFTDTEQTKDVIIVMTKNVAQSLGALDKRFQVNLSYGAPNE